MQSALILMAILGCDDTVTQCHHIEVLDQRWESIQACDAASEQRLSDYSNVNYPVVVAVCQTPGDTGLAEIAGEVPASEGLSADLAEDLAESGDASTLLDDLADMSTPATSEQAAADSNAATLTPPADIPAATDLLAANDETANENDGIAQRVLKLFKDSLPEPESLKKLVSEPVHVATESYSWVAKRFEK